MMRATTIKASAGTVGAVVSYLEGRADRLSRSDDGSRAVGYYVDEDEPPGYWWGDGCDAVDLAGRVEPGQLTNMLHARHPISGETLGRRFGDSSARVFDCTFSAAKSVSVLWALSDDAEVRAQTLAAHDTAVEAALSWFQRHGNHTRRGTDGVYQVDARGLTVGVFRQHTSRTDDPQLHTHAVVWSKVQDDTGKWLALDARFLKRQQKTIGWIYDAALRNELTRRLGVEWDYMPDGAGQSDIVGVSPVAIELFSTRSRQVEAKLSELIGRWSDEHDGADPDPKTIAELERSAAVTSRPAKSHDTNLREAWQARADQAGVELDAIPLRRPLLLPGRHDRESIVAEAVHRVADQQSAWLEADLAREIAALIPPDHAADCDELLDQIDELAAEAFDRCTELHPRTIGPTRPSDGRPATEHVADLLATSDAVLDQEARLLEWAARSTTPAIATPLDPQTAAAGAMAGRDDLVLVVGPAGAGKTTAIRGAVMSLSRAGRPVIGLAPSGKAADVLTRETGCQAQTLAKFLHTHHRSAPHAGAPPAGSTIILDEAGMASTNDLDQLVVLVERHRWRLVCVGDPKQLPAVGRGDIFADWCEALPTHDLEEVHRFAEPWQAGASLLLRRGDRSAAAVYSEHRRVRTSHPALIPQHVAKMVAARSDRNESLSITTSTAEMARSINIEIQRRRAAAGRRIMLADGTFARAGDQIATRRNNPRLATTTGDTVRNRHTWTVDAVHDDGTVTASDPERGTVRLPSSYVAEHVELGWAVTGYGNQGITTDHAICIVEPSSTRAGIYVGLTRGRHKNIALIADPTGTADPEDALAEAISRPANALTAHSTRARLYRAKGLEPPETALDRPAPTSARTTVPLRPLDREVDRAATLLDDFARTQTAGQARGR